MARVSTYLNFARSTEEVFLFYRSVFGTEFTAPIARLGDIPTPPGQPPLAETERLFKALAVGGTFGNLVDQFGVQWMFNCASAV